MNEKLRKHKMTVICLLILFCMEATIVIYSSTIHFSQAQLSDYDQANKDLVQMRREMQSIQLAEKEDPHVRQGLNELLMARPDGCHLLEVAVGDLYDADGNALPYAYVTFMPENDGALQAFRENINRSPMLRDSSIDSIYQDAEGRRVVRLSIRSVQP